MRINEAKDYFFKLHDVDCNQKYDKKLPYSFHLEMVASQCFKFQHILHTLQIKSEDVNSIVIACYGHDAIEDARITYNDIKDLMGFDVAELIYLCTENRGRTRADRKNDQFYEELKTNKNAVFVKLCDIIANVKYGLLTNSGMFKKAKAEYPHQKAILYIEEYKPMFDYLEKIFEIQ